MLHLGATQPEKEWPVVAVTAWLRRARRQWGPVVVTTSPELQRERVLARGTMDAAKLDSIIARQTPDAEKRKRADFVVDTSNGLDPVRAQIKDILAEVVKMPQRRT